MNPLLQGLIGFGIILISAVLLVGFSSLPRKTKPVFRDIPAFARMRHAIGRVVEDGTRLHVSLGRASMVSPQSAAGLAGLTLLRRLAELTSAGDQPPIATSGEPVTTILSQDTLQTASQASAQGAYDPANGRLTGLTPFSFAAGAMPVIKDENVTTNVLVGSFGVEGGLMTEEAARANTFTIAGSNDLSAQAVFLASAQEPLLGEEVFAAGAYTDAGPMHAASLRVQDILRWGLVIVIVLLAILKAVGVL